MRKAHALKKGDTIGIAASASPFDRNEFKRGVHVLKEMGFEVFYREDIFDQTRYLAGSDKRRAEELTELFVNSKVRAILFARGGYGSQRIIPLLDPELLSRHPKPIVGFSDITALLTFLRQKCGLPTFYGPVISTLAKDGDSMTLERLQIALTTAGNIGKVPVGKSSTVKKGTAEGLLAGGCLSLINSSIGTPYELDTKENILFIEETGEKVYVIDRMLTQLKNAGKLDEARGIIIGSIVLPKGEEHDIKAMIMDVIGDFNGPVIMDYPAGHTKSFVTLPLGADVVINATETGSPQIEFKTGFLS